MPIEKHLLQTHSLFEKAGEVFEGVAKLKERIAELERDNRVQKIALEDAYRHVAMILSIRRALWLARAERARIESVYWLNLMYDEKWSSVKFTVRRKHGANVKPRQTTRTPERWFNVWDVVELYCKHKAEEYK